MARGDDLARLRTYPSSSHDISMVRISYSGIWFKLSWYSPTRFQNAAAVIGTLLS